MFTLRVRFLLFFFTMIVVLGNYTKQYAKSNVRNKNDVPKNKIQPLEGRSLRPSFKKDRNQERILMWEHYSNAAIRRGKWKLVKIATDEWELYDINKDRSELNDLATEYPEITQELITLWQKHAVRTRILPRPQKRKR